jgi:hypothetical protein
VNTQKTKQLILNKLKKKESCLKDLIIKIGEQKKIIERKDENSIFDIIEEKNSLIEIFKNLEEEVDEQLQLLPQGEIRGLIDKGEALKTSIENLLKKIVLMEEECEIEIGSNMKELEKKIFGLQKGKKIRKGYGGVFKNRPLISKKA